MNYVAVLILVLLSSGFSLAATDLRTRARDLACELGFKEKEKVEVSLGYRRPGYCQLSVQGELFVERVTKMKNPLQYIELTESALSVIEDIYGWGDATHIPKDVFEIVNRPDAKDYIRKTGAAINFANKNAYSLGYYSLNGSSHEFILFLLAQKDIDSFIYKATQAMDIGTHQLKLYTNDLRSFVLDVAGCARSTEYLASLQAELDRRLDPFSGIVSSEREVIDATMQAVGTCQ